MSAAKINEKQSAASEFHANSILATILVSLHFDCCPTVECCCCSCYLLLLTLRWRCCARDRFAARCLLLHVLVCKCRRQNFTIDIPFALYVNQLGKQCEMASFHCCCCCCYVSTRPMSSKCILSFILFVILFIYICFHTHFGHSLFLMCAWRSQRERYSL